MLRNSSRLRNELSVNRTKVAAYRAGDGSKRKSRPGRPDQLASRFELVEKRTISGRLKSSDNREGGRRVHYIDFS